MEPLISVIIPVYNVEKYLDLCMQDVVNQDYKNIEIILVDDGAKDNSGAVCDSWAEKDKRTVSLHKENGGLSDARNYGLKFAKGEWVTFIDSDDRIACDYISTLLKNATEHNCDIAICDPVHIFNGQKWNYQSSNDIRVFSPFDAIEEMWYQKSFLVSAWGKLYKRAFFDKVQFKKGIIFEDVQMMHRVFEQADKIVYIPSKLYGYVHRENSITTQQFSIKDCGILDICQELINYANSQSKELKEAAEAYYTVGCFRVFLNAPDTEEYARYIKQAKNGIEKYGRKTLKNKKVRRKTKLGLFFYFYLPFMLKLIYRRTNRWK